MQSPGISEGISKAETPSAKRRTPCSSDRYQATANLSSDTCLLMHNRYSDCVSSHGFLGERLRIQVQPFGISRQIGKSRFK